MRQVLESPRPYRGCLSPVLLVFVLVERALRCLPGDLSRRLSPVLDEEDLAEEDAGQGASDLLSVSQRRMATGKGQTRDVVLAIETFTALQSKVVNVATALATLLAYSILITQCVLKATLKNRVYYTSYSYNYACLAVGSACLIALLVRGSIFAARILANTKQGNHWPKRRLRVMSLCFASAIVQILNLVCWIAPNAYLASVPCKWNGWNSSVINAFATLQWTCWNLHFTIFIIQAHNLCAWISPQARSTTQQAAPLVLDAPFWRVHWWKLIPWAMFEAVLIAWVTSFPARALGGGAQGCGPSGHSPIPQGFPLCGRIGPKWGAVSITTFTMAYLLLFIGFMLMGFRQLHARPHRNLRTSVILFRLQSRTTFLAHKVITISTALLWLTNTPTCWSTEFIWFGLMPSQIVTTALIWENCWYFMPSAADEDPILQVYLQDFAWTEGQKPDAVAARAEHAVHAAERAWLTEEPMFCFQTAIAMHRWSCLAYMDLESVKLPGIKETAEEAASSPAGDPWGQGSSDEQPTRNSQGLVMGAVAHPPSLTPSEVAAAQGMASFEGITSDGLGGPERRGSSSSAHTPHSSFGEDASVQTADSAMGSGKTRWRSGKQKQAAKKQRASDQTRVALDAAMSLYGLSSFKLFWNPTTDTKALLAWNGDMAVLAFRGTASLTNACLDLKVWMCAHPPQRGHYWLGTQPRVHTGFHRAWTADGLQTEVMDCLQGLVDSGQLGAQARLLITGHSLGGALAVLAAFDIKRAMPDFRVEMYTYGTPYPGNRAYAQEFNELLPDTWHVIHEGDAVPRTGKFFVGKRPGQRVIVDQLGEMRVRPNVLELGMQGSRKVNPHYLESYRTALQAAMVLQFTRRGTPQGRAGVLALGQQPALRAIFDAEGLDWEAMKEVHTQGKPLPVGKKSRHSRKPSSGSNMEGRSWLQSLRSVSGDSRQPGRPGGAGRAAGSEECAADEGPDTELEESVSP